MNTTLHQIDQEKRKIEQICICNPMTTEFIYVNIDLRHQYGISVAESQTFLLAKRHSACSGDERGETSVVRRLNSKTHALFQQGLVMLRSDL